MAKKKLEMMMYLLLFLTLLHISFFVWDNNFTKTTATTVITTLLNDTMPCSEQCQESCGNDLDCEKKCLSEQCQAESQKD